MVDNISHLDTAEKGITCEYAVVTRFLELGFIVCIPIGPKRYDCVIDRGQGWEKVQIKKAKYTPDYISANTSSSNPQRVRKNYVGDVELIAIFCVELKKTYLIPIGECDQSRIYLRLTPSKNNQSKGVRWAADYEI